MSPAILGPFSRQWEIQHCGGEPEQADRKNVANVLSLAGNTSSIFVILKLNCAH